MHVKVNPGFIFPHRAVPIKVPTVHSFVSRLTLKLTAELFIGVGVRTHLSPNTRPDKGAVEKNPNKSTHYSHLCQLDLVSGIMVISNVKMLIGKRQTHSFSALNAQTAK